MRLALGVRGTVAGHRQGALEPPLQCIAARPSRRAPPAPQNTSELLTKRLLEAEVQSKSINETRSAYQSVATRGSVLYFVITELAGIDPMYQYSLAYFKKLFGKIVRQTPAAADLPQHLRDLLTAITEQVRALHRPNAFAVTHERSAVQRLDL